MARLVYPDADAAHIELLRGRFKERLKAIGDCRLFEGKPASGQEWIERIGDAEAMFLGWGLPDAVLGSLPDLKLIAFSGIGVANHVNLDLAQHQGVTVTNSPGYADDTVAEHTIGLMLACARQIARGDRLMRDGGWYFGDQGVDLKGKTLGIVGLGGIGRRTAQLARAFGMTVIAWTRSMNPSRAADAGVAFVALEDLFRDSDFVSLHLGLTPDTEGMIGADLLRSMKQSAFLVNTARGELLDEAVLVEMLQSNAIAGAGLDVFAGEPPSPDHPLRSLENVVMTPHKGFDTPDANAAILDILLTNMEGYFAGAPVNVVAPA
ncbi:MAG: 2-hydroxyacid dehydrogenase [Rhodospirillales bacterium]